MYTCSYSKQSFKFALLKQSLYVYHMVDIVLTPYSLLFSPFTPLNHHLYALSLPLVLLIYERGWTASCLIEPTPFYLYLVTL